MRLGRGDAGQWKWLPVDAVVWTVAVLAAVWARYDFALPADQYVPALVFAGVAAIANALVGVVVGIYQRRFLPGSFDEALGVALTGLLNGVATFSWQFGFPPSLVPRSVPLTAAAMATLGILAARFVGRAWGAYRRSQHADALPVIVFGAGNAGTQLIRHMQSDPASQFVPRALLDDDPVKRRLQISGVFVRGNRVDLARVVERTGARGLVIALPNADAELLRDLTRRADALGLKVFVLPSLNEMMHRHVGAGDLREIDVHDLLGRRPIVLDEERIAGAITGKRVLVTGAGGSIGAELCRQIHRFGPAELIMLDRDESALHAVQLSLHGRAMLDGDDTVLVDIRDRAGLRRVLLDRRPEVVFHAAALKHLPLLERHPVEAWQTNVVGTWNVLEAARAAGVETFVNISTDKAANPTSVLGTSKRVAERLTAGMATQASGRYVSVRFGNVLGSRGSVLMAFERQIASGGPVTVTHPEVTRFFMTISEACQLVLQASAIGDDGEALVLDMGEPVKIVEVARTLIDMSGRQDVDVVFTGLRDAEKLHEELFGEGEPRDHRPLHELVSHVPVPPLQVDTPDMDAARFADAKEARDWLAEQASATSAAVRGVNSIEPHHFDLPDPVIR